ncbi:MAG: GNAT family N-acetyltransferase [Acidimicrobiales bacterium]
MPPAPTHLTHGSDRVRIVVWNDRPSSRLVTPVTPTAAPLSPDTVARVIEHVRDLGCDHLMTSALTAVELDPFASHGFTVRGRLHLLSHDLRFVPDHDRRSLRRARRRDRSSVLTIDRAAFDEFWRLDRRGLLDALDATPVHRFRVTRGDAVGYVICGRAGATGYLQRLAVHPRAQGRGIGRTLVADSLRWLRGNAAREALVNTQVGNGPALDLYERMGFRLRPDELSVMELRLTGRRP